MSMTKVNHEAELQNNCENQPIEMSAFPIETRSIYHALICFQLEVPNLMKNAQGYGYKFVELSEILSVIKPILAKYGLGIIQPLEENGIIKTVLYHEPTGQTIESKVEIPKNVQLKGMNDFQVLGSAISYLRRYSISSMLSLITEQDNDASGSQVKQAAKPQSVPQTKKLLSPVQFDKAVEAIQNGEYTKTKLFLNYSLTSEQTETLNNL